MKYAWLFASAALPLAILVPGARVERTKAQPPAPIPVTIHVDCVPTGGGVNAFIKVSVEPWRTPVVSSPPGETILWQLDNATIKAGVSVEVWPLDPANWPFVNQGGPIGSAGYSSGALNSTNAAVYSYKVHAVCTMKHANYGTSTVRMDIDPDVTIDPPGVPAPQKKDLKKPASKKPASN